MCTCVRVKGKDLLVGRNMDIEYSFGENLVVTPRNYPWQWREEGKNKESFAIMGMATVMDNYPLYAEAVNEKGLVMASLNFPGNAAYHPKRKGKINLTPFELIPYILTKFETVADVMEVIDRFHLVDENFKEEVPLAPLHFILMDEEDCIVLEPEREGLKIYQNPIGVLTNNPPFPQQMINLQNYGNLQVENPSFLFQSDIKSTPYGQGLGGVGLPGDASPMSRFVRSAFYKTRMEALNPKKIKEQEIFHILDSVKMLRGSVKTPEGKWDITTYTVCINATKGIYLFKTYENPQIYRWSFDDEDLEDQNLKVHGFPKEFQPLPLN
ncbi:MAG: choloylglycine hydrolase [Tissierellia bacterium]|nr:choloylglycine hydrolase [Tissierellia bacterium]